MMTRRRMCCACLCATAALVAMSGAMCVPGVTDPAEFTNADAARGGSLYDKWWAVTGATEPTTDHALYPAAGQQSGADTWRCKECHGWDYKGKDGQYGDVTSSHYTGIVGIFGTTLSAQEVFDKIKGGDHAHAAETADHGFHDVLSDTDIWDLAKFVLTEGQFDTDDIIDSNGNFTGNTANGSTLYSSGIAGGIGCATCHGADGKTIDFHGGEGVGGVAKDNAWEFQHKVRFGHPGTAMPSSVSDGGTAQDVNDVGAHAQTL